MNKLTSPPNPSADHSDDYCGTTYAAKLLGLSVGSIQHLVERGELAGWKTQGGHRRISLSSVHAYQVKHNINNVTQKTTPDKRLRVLLVEDDTLTREMLQQYMDNTSPSIDCTAVSSGLEALMEISNIKPHLMISDLRMPGIDGFELLRTLRQNPQFEDMKILALSAMNSDEIESRGGLPINVIYKSKPVKADWFDGFFLGLSIDLTGS